MCCLIIVIMNFLLLTCYSSMRRAPEHCMNFVLAEAGTTGAIDGSGRLVIRGRFKPSNIEHILKNYIGMTTLVWIIVDLFVVLLFSRIRQM